MSEEQIPHEELENQIPEGWQTPPAKPKSSLWQRGAKAIQDRYARQPEPDEKPLVIPDGGSYRAAALILGCGAFALKIFLAFTEERETNFLFPCVVVALLLLLVSEVRAMRAEAMIMEQRRLRERQS